ncbi:MAG: ribosome small subunit-dependent GTPase A [Lachnospiraceae bacterium]|nr:ribosome small subunit-dependent GTPase A [Lachnospiraceae bacterium]
MTGILKKYGFDPLGEYPEPEEGYYGRIISQSKGLYNAISEEGELLCEISGKMRFEASDAKDLPAVGDFVILDRDTNESGHAIIRSILPRKSAFVRNASGSLNSAQIVAANIDHTFICTSLNQDFNLKRLERYITLTWNSGAVPVIVLTKADLCEDIDSKLSAVESVAPGCEILLTSSVDEDGLEEIEQFLKPGKTVALMGSSGVGKSTIINRLMNDSLIHTGDIRSDDRGRHTTTQRQMYLLPSGAILIDTPGMREIGLVSETDDLSQSFEDVEQFFGRCRFSDCTHTSEPGCAIFEAIASGQLSEKRWNSYNRLRAEYSFAQDKAAHMEKKKKNQQERRAARKEMQIRKRKK